MANKIIAVIFFLVAAAFGLFFFAVAFRHGWNEGLIQLQRMDGELMLYGLGIVAFLIASIVVGFRKRGQ